MCLDWVLSLLFTLIYLRVLVVESGCFGSVFVVLVVGFSFAPLLHSYAILNT